MPFNWAQCPRKNTTAAHLSPHSTFYLPTIWPHSTIYLSCNGKHHDMKNMNMKNISYCQWLLLDFSGKKQSSLLLIQDWVTFLLIGVWGILRIKRSSSTNDVHTSCRRQFQELFLYVCSLIKQWSGPAHLCDVQSFPFHWTLWIVVPCEDADKKSLLENSQ